VLLDVGTSVLLDIGIVGLLDLVVCLYLSNIFLLIGTEKAVYH